MLDSLVNKNIQKRAQKLMIKPLKLIKFTFVFVAISAREILL